MTAGRWGAWVAAARPRTLTAAVSPVVVGTAFALRDGRFDPGAAALCLIFALLTQVGTNFGNDYYDFVHGADTPDRVGPRRAVAAGLVTPRAMRRAMLAVFVLAFVAGLGLLSKGGPWLLLVGAASIASGYLYTGGPWPLGYLGLGDLFVFVFFGLVAVGVTYFVQARAFAADVVLAGVGIGLLAANILLVNNYRDAETDAAAGKRTLVVRFGRGFARVQHGLSLGVAMAIPFVLWRRTGRAGCLLPLLLAPGAAIHVGRLARSKTPAGLIALLGATARYLAVYAGLMAIGVIL